MKTNYLKIGILLITTIGITSAAKAQKNDSLKQIYYADRYSNYDHIENTGGRLKEHIRTNWKNKVYEMTLVNNTMTGLYVEGEKIPAANWGKYSTVIAAIREQIRKDRIQAKKDQAQARLDQIQAGKDQEQARRDQQQAEKDQVQARLDQKQAERDQEEARKDQAQANEEAKRDQEQARKDQAQAKLDQEQAQRDQEQARLDQIQAKKDQEEARKDQELMKQLIADVVSDKIVPDEKSLHDLTIDDDEMTVNGKKQPDDVFRKYKEKYKRFSQGNFSYENSPDSHSIHISRNSYK